ncbi:hypothetical protein OG782_00210 [Streptomyces sp. NBC_00876]|uniref:hypothetical protein n=1 Tax=Streptomyces sp. NBC_00876 TaxID=2975853 RepID=UPI003866CA5C|nr:hypothetical protein OG782_00210 [Streptomyces sp. NBC_00876]
MTTTIVAPTLLEQLRALPDDAFTRVQYIAPQCGCYNGCAMCSQFAGRETWGLTRDGLTGLFTALAQVAAERNLAIASGRIHHPRVVFPYLDNDIGSYPHLDHYAALARDVLGVKLRISTVGYSSHAVGLTAMHRRLVDEHSDSFDGVRFSVTPYTLGYTGRAGTSRQAYITDLAAALATYRPLLDALGHGAATAACELRFAPLVGIHPLTDTYVDGHHVLACGPHLLISRAPATGELPETVIERLDERTQPVYSLPGTPYLHITSDTARPTPGTVRAALASTLTVAHTARQVRMHRFTNADGPYFAADPDFHTDGTFTALHLYPPPASGPPPGTPTPLGTCSTPSSPTSRPAAWPAAPSSPPRPARTSTPSWPRSPPAPKPWKASTRRRPPTCASRSIPRSPRTRPRWRWPATRRACSSPAPSPSTPGRSSTRAAPRSFSAA